MGEVKSTQITISLEPTLAQRIRANNPNASAYIRELILMDLLKKEQINIEDLVAILT